MSARDMRNLLLEYRSSSEERGVDAVQIPLANIPGHSYSIGTLYPGDVKGEGFIFCRGYKSGLISPSHCAIRVDGQGQYWIQNDGGGTSSISFYDTFVNSVRVEGSESRLLKSGDIISLGSPETDWDESGRPPHPIYRVMEEGVCAGPPFQVKANYAPEESPFDNGLILSKIMSNLPLSDLRNARLVNKMWNGEASILLEKRGKVSFNFGTHCVNPQSSTKVARYLQEMLQLKIQNLHIRLPSYCDEDQNPLCFSPGQPGDQMLSDLRKLLNSSHNFSSLSLECSWKFTESAFTPLFLILQEVGGKLVELEFEGYLGGLPENLSQLPKMSYLRKLTHAGWMEEEFTEKWASHLVPLFTQSLEHFHTGCVDLGEAYLQEFIKYEMPKLKGIKIEDIISEDSLSHLLELRTPLTLLKINYSKYGSESGEDCTLLEKLLLKNSKSLQNLDIWFSEETKYERIQVRFPSFPKLEELKLNCKAAPGRMKIHWESGDLEYKKHLPSLRKLSVANWFRRRGRGYADEDDPVFDSFFPEGGAVARREGVKEVRLLEVKAQPRMDRIKETFPNAEITLERGDVGGYLYEHDSSDEDPLQY